MVFKRTTINSFYKKDIVVDVPREQAQNSSCSEEDEIANWLAAQQEDDQEEKAPEQPSPKVRRVNFEDISMLVVERDPGLRCQIQTYPPHKQEQVIRAYMKHGPYQFF
jgi:23S rRNA-/tRNA-specific pseudouridylate synthase